MHVDTAQPAEPFVPECLDCGYDLTSLPDGRCPECGHSFTFEMLVAAAAARGRRLDMARRSVFILPLAAALSATCFGSAAQSYLVFTPLLLLVAGAGLLFSKLWHDYLLTQSHVLLLLLLPLFTLLVGISTNQHPWPGIVTILAASLLVAWGALRWSPLISAALLLALVATPMAGVGVFMVVDGITKQNHGHHWSEFDWPAVPNWRALTAAQGVFTGTIIAACSAVVASSVVFFARRALVRLRRHRRAPTPTLAQLQAQLREQFPR